MLFWLLKIILYQRKMVAVVTLLGFTLLGQFFLGSGLCIWWPSLALLFPLCSSSSFVCSLIEPLFFSYYRLLLCGSVNQSYMWILGDDDLNYIGLLLALLLCTARFEANTLFSVVGNQQPEHFSLGTANVKYVHTFLHPKCFSNNVIVYASLHLQNQH